MEPRHPQCKLIESLAQPVGLTGSGGTSDKYSAKSAIKSRSVPDGLLR